MIDFNERKQTIERGMGVKELLKTTLDDSDEFQDIIIIIKTKSQEVELSYSWDSSIEALGMAEVAKALILQTMSNGQ